MAVDLPLARLVGSLVVLTACALFSPAGDARADAIGVGASPPLLWRGATSSPEPLPSNDARDGLYEVCGDADAGLRAVAARNAARIARGEPSIPGDELTFAVRAAGLPYVWPRAWSMRGTDLDPDKMADELAKFVAKSKPLGQRRCGVARIRRSDGSEVVSAVVVDALADLEPVPTVVRVGAWITLKAHMLVPASEAKVVLLAPHGQPRTVLASLSGADVRTTFSVDQPGVWVVQVLASGPTGPRPVVEAHVIAGTAAPLAFAETAAPGEDAAPGSSSDAEGVRAMINGARASENAKPLSRDPALDKLAQEHSARMRDQRIVGHDVGDGDLVDRLNDAGISFQSRGENLAAAANAVRAHRALWLSPSHRSNLLDARFTRVGIGIAKSDDGRVWITQLFVD